MQRVIRALGLALTVYAPPLLADLDKLVTVPVLLGALGAVALMLSQPDVSKNETNSRRRTDRYSVVAILVAGWVAHVLPIIEWSLRGFPLSAGMLLAGTIVLAAGLGFRIYSIQILGRFFTATVQIRGDHQLIKIGPYAKVRHPSYLGALVAMVGHALIFGAPVSACLAVIVMCAAYRYRIQVEESALRNAFGMAYRTYAQQSSKLIPYVW